MNVEKCFLPSNRFRMKKQKTSEYGELKNRLREVISDYEGRWASENSLRKELRESLVKLCEYEQVRIDADPAWIPDAESEEIKRQVREILGKKATWKNALSHRTLTLEVSPWLYNWLRVQGKSLSKYFLGGEKVTPELYARCALCANVFGSWFRDHALKYPLMAEAARTRYGFNSKFEEQRCRNRSYRDWARELYVSALDGLSLFLPVEGREDEDVDIRRPFIKACLELVKTAETQFGKEFELEATAKDHARYLRVRAERYLRG